MMTLSLGVFRTVLLLILMVGIVGTGLELVLLGHTEDLWQWEPLVLLALGAPVLLWHAWAGTTWSRRLSVGLMLIFTASGLLGIFLHYRGNVEFELEMVPALDGVSLFREAMTGATPVLAPGTMVQLGLLGLLYALVPAKKVVP